MRSTVDRVHIRCETDPADGPRALEIRSRLERTARVHLADALERTFRARPERRVFVERVRVALDFDLESLDDVTLATLWADRVRGALETAERAGDDGVEIFETDESFYSAAAVEYAEHGSLRGVFAELSCGAGAPPPLAFFAAFDTDERVLALVRTLVARVDLARAVHARLAPAARAATRAALLGLASWPPTLAAGSSAGGGSSSSAVRPGAVDSRAAHGGSSRRPGETAGTSPPREAAPPGPDTSAGEESFERFHDALRIWADGGAHDVVLGSTGAFAPRSQARPRRGSPFAHDVTPTRVEATAPRTREPEPRSTGHDIVRAATGENAPARRPLLDGADLQTSIGGLVLLYPWLADLLTPADVPEHLLESYRRRVLAAVGGDEALLLDPLVVLLAGADPTEEPAAEVVELPGELAGRIAGEADGTIRSFAAVLAGFEGSTPAYLRRFLIVRGGVLRPLDDESWSVRLGPAPLDPILSRLPYPLGPFRFAWSPVIHVSLPDA